MSTTIIKGDSAPHDHYTGGRRESSGPDETVTFVRQGKYDALKSSMPLRGEKYDGKLVISSDLAPTRGGMGMLTIKCVAAKVTTVDFEIDTAQLEKPLLSHPKFEDVAEQVELWKNAAPELRAAYKYTNASGGEESLSGNALKAAKLIERGVESYLEFSPVVRKTTTKTGSSSQELWSDVGEKCGTRDKPPSKLRGMVGGSWDWLKTADRATQTGGGSGQRVEEWTGANQWDKTLYGD